MNRVEYAKNGTKAPAASENTGERWVPLESSRRVAPAPNQADVDKAVADIKALKLKPEIEAHAVKGALSEAEPSMVLVIQAGQATTDKNGKKNSPPRDCIEVGCTDEDAVGFRAKFLSPELLAFVCNEANAKFVRQYIAEHYAVK
jgi:hypothetical protein